MRLKMIRLIFLLTSLMAYNVSAQTDYVVLAKGDTLYGSVRYLNMGNDQKIVLSNPSRKKTYYEKTQLKAFAQDGHRFHTLRTNQGYTVMKLIKDGYLSLYAFQMENQSTWDGQYLYKRDGTGLEVSSLLFRKRMKEFLYECPDLVVKLETKELTRTDLNTIIDQFNACVEQQTLAAKMQTEKESKLDELEKAVTALEDSESRTTALEVIAELRLKVQRGEKIPTVFEKTLLSALAAYPQLTELAQAALRETQR
jgi:hypothetical protein